MKRMILMLIFLMTSSFSIQAQTTVVTQKDQAILMIKIGETDEVLTLNQGHKFTNPLIDSEGRWVAYQNEKNEIYISTLQAPSQVVFEESKVSSYAWDEGTLIYSKMEGGIYQYDSVKQKTSVILEPNGFYYEGLMPNHQGHLFAQKAPVPKAEIYSEPIGIVDYELAIGVESLVVPNIPQPELGDPSGRISVNATLSVDGHLLYVWCKSHSASMSADGVPLGIYNSETNQFKQINADQVMILTYSDQLAVSPTANNLLALVNGSGRFMNENKQIGILNVENQSLGIITQPNIVGMTPSFTKDGTQLLYSAGPELKETYQPFAPGLNHIYQYNLQTYKQSQLTHGTEGFDFYPQDIGNGEILFLRVVAGENLILIKRDGMGRERIVVEQLPLEDYNYYGHFDASKVLTIHSV